MTKPALKIGPLPDRTPVKLTLLIDPALRAQPEAYATVYAEAHSERSGVETQRVPPPWLDRTGS